MVNQLIKPKPKTKYQYNTSSENGWDTNANVEKESSTLIGARGNSCGQSNN